MTFTTECDECGLDVIYDTTTECFWCGQVMCEDCTDDHYCEGWKEGYDINGDLVEQKN